MDSASIRLRIEAKTTGWVGFGLGEPTSGSMPGGDMLIGYVFGDGSARVEDRYAVAKETPVLDWIVYSVGAEFTRSG